MSHLVIVGAGVGGLAAAIRLRGQGHEVTVLEKNATPGGRCNRLQGEGFTFDSGPTLLLMPDVIHELFASSGADWHNYLDMTRLRPNYRLTFGDGSSLELGHPPEETAAQLEALEPGAAVAYDAFLREARYRYKIARQRFVERNFRRVSEFATIPNLRALLATRALRPLWRDTRRYFRDERLCLAFSFQTMYLGMSPLDAMAIYALLPSTELEDGIWYPRGGLYSLVAALVRRLGELGGVLETRSEVRRVLVEDGRASGVELVDGRRLAAEGVVMNADLPYAYAELLPRSARHPLTRLRHRHFRHGASAFMLYLGTDCRYPHLLHHNVLFARDVAANFAAIFKHQTLPAEPSIYVNVASATDPLVAPAGGEAIYVLVPVPCLGRVDWATEAAPFRERVLDLLERRLGLTDLRRHLVFERMQTPADWQTSYHLDHGSAFGLAHNFLQVGYLRPANRSRRVAGLYFVGASTVPGGGLPMVMLSARLVAERIAEDGARERSGHRGRLAVAGMIGR
jgi:phytoene desaturase